MNRHVGWRPQLTPVALAASLRAEFESFFCGRASWCQAVKPRNYHYFFAFTTSALFFAALVLPAFMRAFSGVSGAP